MRVLVVTCAHRGDDARIVHRQARSLLEAGHSVTLIAPGPESVEADPDGLRRVDVPRATGRRRIRSWRASRRAVRNEVSQHDIVIVHDPELVPVLFRYGRARPMVWDVHEDFVASVSDRRWIPRPARGLVTSLVRQIERLATGRLHVMLAEDSYVERFADAPVVPNSTWVPELVAQVPVEPRPRVVYVGRLSVGRGVDELISFAQLLSDRVEVVLVGAADADVEASLSAAHDSGVLRWLGPQPNPVALQHLQGALAGLSLLRDEPNYRHSRPTKVMEYLAHGVPVVTTPLPLAAELIHRSGGGRVVEYGDVGACADVIDEWLDNPGSWQLAVTSGHAYVEANHNWQRDGARFVALLESWAATAH